MATVSVLNLGLSGLKVYQRALQTTAHNISNVNTPGFSRQEPVLSTRPAQFTGAGYSGGGVQLTTIRRAYDQYIVEQLRAQTSVTKELEVQNDLSARLENLFSDDSAGLGPALRSFFDSVAGAAEDPTSIAARQVMLSNTANTAGRFGELQSRLDELHGELSVRMRTVVSEVNALAGTIADINSQLIENVYAPTAQPNDLLDQRDEAVRQLAERIDVSTVANDDGSINVMVGSGHTLVMRTDVNELAVTPNANDPSQADVVVGSAKSISLSSIITGGEIGGLLNMQSGVLGTAERELGRLALAFAEGINQQHQQGMDLFGQIGGLLVTDINDPMLQDARTINNANNSGDAELLVAVDDVSALTISDYRLDLDNTGYHLTRLSDGALVSNFAGLPQTLVTEGFTINLGSGVAAAGDSFLVSPTAGIARQVETQIDDPRSIALAAPVRAQSALANLGDARISQERVSNLTGIPLANPIALIFDAASNQFNVSTLPPTTLAYDPATDSGNEFTLSSAVFGDIQFTLSGAPADGDEFTLESNQGGSGDNRNGLALGAVRLEKQLEGGTVSIEEGFGLMLADMGSRGRQLDMNFAAQSSMLSQVQAEQQAVSGVNLDEEAVDLMRYQQAYEASAKVISVADELFNVLLRMTG